LFPGPTDVDLARLGDEAFNALWPQIPQEVSLPNFLYELRDLKDMIPKVEEGLTKTVAGGYLTYAFGYAPFVSDVTKLRNLAKTVADRLAYLRRTYGRETRVSFTGTFDVPVRDFVTEGTIYYTLPGYSGEFRCGGYLFHRLNSLYGLEGTLRGFAGALGLNNPVGVLWEATPYSFVADWFTRTRGIVNKMAVQPFEGEWEIRRLTYSARWQAVWHVHQDVGSPYTPQAWPLEDGVAKFYARRLGFPASSSILTETWLEPRQQMLAAALLASLR
jgi:hypothetical protein